MNLVAFLIGLAVFVLAVVLMVASRVDLFQGGIDIGLSVAVIALTYPSVLNRSP
jgi:hypothetical protein